MISSSDSQKGFTLIELLVVISIIGLLSSIVLAAVSNARAKGAVAAGLSSSTNLYTSYGDTALAYWPLNEGPGTTIIDQAGTHGGSLPNSPEASWSNLGDDPTGKSYSLLFTQGNTSGAPLNLCSNTNTLTINPAAATFVAWIKTTSTAQQSILSNRGGTGNSFFGTISGYVFYYGMNSFSATAGINSVKPINDGKWHFVVWTTNGSKSAFYIDGAIDSTYPGSSTTGNVGTICWIGNDPPAPSPFVGNISQVAVYTQSLGLSEIQKLYAMSAPAYGIALK